MAFSSLTPGGAGLLLTSNGGSLGSFTIPNNGVVMIPVATAANTIPAIISVAVSGTLSIGTWTDLINPGTVYGTRRMVFLLTAKNTTGSDQTGTIILTFTNAGGTYQEHMVEVLLETATVASPFGAIGQSVGNAAAGSVLAPGTVTADKYAMSFIVHTDASASITAGGEAGSIVTQLGGGGNVRRFAVARNTSPDASPTPSFTWSGAQDYAVLAWLVEVTDLGGGDTTAPTLSSPAGTGGLGVCSGSVSTDEGNGTLYAVATASATAPTAAQVKAGQDHTGTAALRVVSQSVSATGTQTVASGAITGGAGTRYLHYMHEDAAANQSTVASSAGFTITAAATSMTIALKLADTTTAAASITGIEYAILNASTLGAATAVLDTGTGESTDGSGNLVLDITGLGLANGDVRYVIAGKSNGTPGAAFDGWQGPATAA